MPANTISDPSLLTNAQTPQTLQAWNNLLESVFGTPATNTSGSSSTTGTTTSSTSTTSDANDPIKALLALLIPGSMGGVANPQNQALIQGLLTQFKESAGGLSGIQAAGNSAGVYNSSTQGLLANDAMSRAIAAAAGTIGTQQNQQQQIIAQLLATLSAGSRNVNQVGTNNTVGQTNSSSSKGGSLGSGGAGNALKALGAGAAAAQAAKMIKNAMGGSNGLKEGQGRQDDQDDTSAMAPYVGGQGRSDSSDDTSGMTGTSPVDAIDPGNNDDPGAIDSIDQFENSNTGDFADPFGIGGFDIGDFTANDTSEPNFDFIDVGGEGGAGEDIPDFTGGDF